MCNISWSLETYWAAEPTADPISIHFSAERGERYPARLAVTYGPIVAGFLGKDYRYKSVATQIPHDAGLALIRLVSDRIRDRCLQSSDSLIQI